MKSFLTLALVLFSGLPYAFGNGPEGPCEESARVAAISHLVQKYGDDFVTMRFGPYSYVTKDEAGREVIRVTFHTGANETNDIETHAVYVTTTDSKRGASKIHRCVIYSVTDTVLRPDHR